MLPGGVKGVTYSEVSDIDFTVAKTKKKLLDISLSSPQTLVDRPQSEKVVDTPVALRQDTKDIHFTTVATRWGCGHQKVASATFLKCAKFMKILKYATAV